VADSPYRSAVSETKLEARTERGTAVLHVAPKHTRLEIGSETWTVANDHITQVIQGKRRAKKKSILLRGSRLFVARAWPTNEMGLWVEVQRLLGLPPCIGMTEEIMATWGDLDRLSLGLQEALSSYADGARAVEIGNGQHRVLALEYDDRMVLYARPVFREKPRRVIELNKDGSLVLPVRKKDDRIIPMKLGVKVIASGDRVYFCHPDGEHAAGVFLPWIGPAERKELTRRFQELVGEPLRARDASTLMTLVDPVA
jgi:hypothetical protein